MKRSIYLILASASLGLFASASFAETVTQTSSMSGGENWNDATFWSNGEAPSADNDYITGGSLTVRTPGGSVGNTTFGGGSLTLKDTASLYLRANGSNQATVDRLIIETNNTTTSNVGGGHRIGPRIHNAVGEITRLNGAIELTGSGSFTIDPEHSDRTITINSQITAAETVQSILAQGSSTGGSVTITNGANAFSGTWIVERAALVGTTDGSFGSGSFQVKNLGVLNFGYDFAAVTSSLAIETGGKLQLEQNLTFGSVSVAGTSLSAGVYTFEDLNSTFDGYFIGAAGVGSITVVPEPSQVALTMVGIVGLLAICVLRRR